MRVAYFFLSSFCLLISPCAAIAAGGVWTTEPKFELSYGYNTNLQLEPQDEIETSRLSVTTGLDLRRSSRSWDFNAGVDWTRLDYESAGFANSDDYRARLNLGRATQRLSWSLGADAERRNIVTTAIEDTGLVDLGIQRERTIGQGSLSYQSSGQVSWNLNVRQERAAYEQSERFVDYRYSGASLSRTTQLSPRTAFSVRADFGDFRTDDKFTESETYGLSLGFDQRLSETLSWYATAGLNRTRSTDTFAFFSFLFTESSEDDGWTADLGLRKQWRYSALRIGASQSIQPSGQGALTTRRGFDVALRHDLSADFAIRLSGSVLRFEDTSDVNRTNNDRSFARLALAFDLDVARHWQVVTELSHRTQDFDRRDDVSRGSVASITLRYIPLDRGSR